MWTIFCCMVFLSGVSGDCTTHLKITAPPNITTLAGSCVRIPCTYEPVPSNTELENQHFFGVWIKKFASFAQNPENIIFNNSGESVYDGTLEGELKELNCTTLFRNFQINQTDDYFFRIDGSPFRATANCTPVYINVIDSPPSPTFRISPPELREEQFVTLTCSAPTYCPYSPPRLTWTLQGHNTPNQVQEHNETSKTFMTTIQTSFYLTDQHDRYNVSCSAIYLVNEDSEKLAENNVILNVSYTPKDTSVSLSPSVGLTAGNHVNLTCSSRAKPSVSRFTWLRKNPDGTQNEIDGQHLHDITLAEGEVYVCIAFNSLGNQTSAEIRVTGLVGWPVIVGAVFGVLVLVFFIVIISFWLLKAKAQFQKSREGLTASEIAAPKDDENVHYGEINFAKFKPKNSSTSSHPLADRGQQEDTVYAQVKPTTKAEN